MVTLLPPGLYLPSEHDSPFHHDLVLWNRGSAPLMFKIRADRSASARFFLDVPSGVIDPGLFTVIRISSKSPSGSFKEALRDRFIVISTVKDESGSLYESTTNIRVYLHEPPSYVAISRDSNQEDRSTLYGVIDAKALISSRSFDYHSLSSVQVSYVCDQLEWPNLDVLYLSSYSSKLVSPVSVVDEVEFVLEPQMLNWNAGAGDVSKGIGKSVSSFECPNCFGVLSVVKKDDVQPPSCKFKCLHCGWVSSASSETATGLFTSMATSVVSTPAHDWYRQVCRHLYTKVNEQNNASPALKPASVSLSSLFEGVLPAATDVDFSKIPQWKVPAISVQQSVAQIPFYPSSLSECKPVCGRLHAYCAHRDPANNRIMSKPVVDEKTKALSFSNIMNASLRLPSFTAISEGSHRDCVKVRVRNPDPDFPLSLVFSDLANSDYTAPPVAVTVHADDGFGKDAPPVFDKTGQLWVEGGDRNYSDVIFRSKSSLSVESAASTLRFRVSVSTSRSKTEVYPIDVVVRLHWQSVDFARYF
eukprot:ANDGO_08524.mRNA.1 hypothetical protein